MKKYVMAMISTIVIILRKGSCIEKAIPVFFIC